MCDTARRDSKVQSQQMSRPTKSALLRLRWLKFVQIQSDSLVTADSPSVTVDVYIHFFPDDHPLALAAYGA